VQEGREGGREGGERGGGREREREREREGGRGEERKTERSHYNCKYHKAASIATSSQSVSLTTYQICFILLVDVRQRSINEIIPSLICLLV
jgi:hypothetical protein